MTMTLKEMATLGGFARAKKMTKQQRRASSQKALAARWPKPKKPSKKK